MKYLLIAGALALAGCAASPETIQPTYVNSVPLEAQSCPSLTSERDRITYVLARASDQQQRARTDDTVGVLLLGMPLGSMSGENIASQVAVDKGQLDAVNHAMQHNACG